MTDCPHPEKIACASERAARAAVKAIKRSRRDGLEVGVLHAYRCGQHWHCGHGHLTRPTEFGRKFRP